MKCLPILKSSSLSSQLSVYSLAFYYYPLLYLLNQRHLIKSTKEMFHLWKLVKESERAGVRSNRNYETLGMLVLLLIISNYLLFTTVLLVPLIVKVIL